LADEPPTAIHETFGDNNKIHVGVGEVKTGGEGTKATDVAVFISLADGIPKALEQLVSDDIFKFARSYKVIKVADLLM